MIKCCKEKYKKKLKGRRKNFISPLKRGLRGMLSFIYKSNILTDTEEHIPPTPSQEGR